MSPPHAWPGRLRRITPRVAFGVTLVVHLVVGIWYTGRLRVSGDEPHYLVMAQSLWREGDLDLEDNYGREDWREFTPGPVRPHYAAPRKDGRPFPAHSVGLPLLLAVPYELARRPGTVVVLALASALAVAFAVALARHLGGRPDVALLAGAGPPLLFYGFHAYTEGWSAACLALAGWALVAGTGIPAALVAALAAVALPWLHLKMALAAATIGAFALIRFRGRQRLLFVAVATIGALAFAAHYTRIFGSPNPFAIYGGVPGDMAGSPARALAGLVLDRTFGLLPWAPVFLVALAGLVTLARTGAPGRILLALAIAALLPALPWRMWWGGQCPPARFLVPLVPVLAVAAALRVAEGRGFLARCWPWLAAVGWALALRVVVDPGELLLVSRADRPSRLWQMLDGVGQVLPSFTPAGDLRVASAWVIALVGLLALDAWTARRGPGGSAA